MKRASFIGCFAIIVLALMGGLLYLSTQIPDVVKQMPPNTSPLVVTLTTPSNDATIPLNDATTIGVDAVGAQPIVAVEVWVDGVRLFAQPSDAGLKRLVVTWSWVPQGEGTHTLIARARDAQQREGQSNVVRVVASPDANPTTLIAYKPAPGDTLPGIADKFKVPPQQVIDANPQINPNDPIPADQAVSVPVPETSEPGPGADTSTPDPAPNNPPPPPDPGQGAPPGLPDKNFFWIKALGELFSKSNPPAKPLLGAAVDGCNVQLTIADQSFNEDGFYIQREGPTPLLTPIATLGAHNGASSFVYTDSNLAQGEYVYYVVAFNPAGTALSNPVQVKIAASQCKPSMDWGKFFKPIKIILKQPVDKVYCYLRINDGDWQRIPHAPNTFLPPNAQGTFDVSAFLKSLPYYPLKGKMTLELDCWGWKGSTLIYLGNAKEVLDAGLPVQMKASQFDLSGVLPDLNLPTQQFMGGGFPSITPPSDLKYTFDPKECVSHMPGPLALLGALLCPATIESGDHAVLVWNWWGACWPGDTNCVTTIDGYRVYREDYPAPSLVQEVQGQDLTVAMIPLANPPWPVGSNAPPEEQLKYAALSKNCYFVRAFKGGAGESPDSSIKICLPWKPQGEFRDLTPAHRLNRYVYNAHTESYCTRGYKPSEPPPDQIRVGYEHEIWDDCDGYYNVAWRGAVYFDLSNIPQYVYLDRATLKYSLLDSHQSYGNTATNERVNCATHLGLGKDKWMGKDFGDAKYWIPSEAYTTLPSTLGTTPGQEVIQLNVTDAVKQWIQGTRPNYGFVLRSNTEALNHEDNNACISDYGNFHLELEYRVP